MSSQFEWNLRQVIIKNLTEIIFKGRSNKMAENKLSIYDVKDVFEFIRLQSDPIWQGKNHF